MESIVGNGPTDIATVLKAMRQSTSFDELLRNWKSLGTALGLDNSRLLELNNKISSESIQLQDVVGEILKAWRAKTGSKATLEFLCKSLTECGVTDVAETLISKFATDACCHNDNNFLMQDSQEELLLKRFSIPSQPSYYISRTLKQSTKLKPDIFTASSTQNHKFFVRKTDDYAALISSYVIKSNRFIISKCEGDLKKVCLKYPKHLHIVEHFNGCMYWIDSTSGFKTLANFLEGNDEKMIEEHELADQIANFSYHRATCISDSAGMGKTYLSLNLAHNVQQRCSDDTIVWFIIFQEFMRANSDNLNSQVDTKHAIELLVSYACRGKDELAYFTTLLRSTSQKFVIFFDGYDELLPDHRKYATKFLRAIKSKPNIKICVTTRPHLQMEIESLLHTKAFEILPLAEDNQIKFLTDEWCRIHKAENADYLKSFAKSCLRNVQNRITNGERDIAGVPLQCAMLAEAYLDEAKLVLTKKSDSGVKVNISSVFSMYKSLVETKFNKILKHSDSTETKLGSNLVSNLQNIDLASKKKQWVQAHTYRSVELLFPTYLKSFEKHFSIQNILNDDEMYSIGLIEKSPHLNTPRFVHRTYAEYLFAQFLVKKIKKCSITIGLVLKNIFGEDGVNIEKNTNKNRNRAYWLKYPVIAYFFDRHLEDLRRKPVDYDLISNSIKDKEKCQENLYIALASTSSNNLENAYGLAEKIFINLDKKDIHGGTALRNTHFKHLPHSIIEHAKSLTLLKKVLNLTKSEYQVGLCFHVYNPIPRFELSKYGSYDAYKFPWIPKCNPLHVCIFYGYMDIYNYLVELYGEEIRNMKYLLHVCVRDSVNNNESVVSNKKIMIEELVKINRSFLEEVFEDSGCTPLLQRRVHFELLETLVQNGANINAHSKIHGTVVHRVKMHSSMTYATLLQWAIDNKFNRFDFRNRNEMTPLLCAMHGFGVIDNKALDIFHKTGANFNEMDSKGYSVLFHAISGTHCTDILARIIDLGAYVNHTAKNGDTVAHVLIRRLGGLSATGLSAKSVLILLKLLVSKSFKKIHQANLDELTPLHFAVRAINVEAEILQYFKEIEANFNAVDKQGDSVLFHAISWNQNDSCIETILECGGNLYHRNSRQRTALHTATKYGNFSALKCLLNRWTLGVNVTDSDGSSPLHRLFLRENKENIQVLEILLQNGAKFDLENSEGRVPLLQWIHEGKIDFSVLVKKSDLLTITSDLASKAINLLVKQRALLQKCLISTVNDNDDWICAFINLLIEKGGKVEMADGCRFEWSKIGIISSKILDQIITLTPELQHEISKRVSTVDQNASSNVSFTYFVKQFSIPIEVVISSLLKCNKYNEFLNLCLVLDGQKLRALIESRRQI